MVFSESVVKRIMAEREGEITHVQDTKCKTMLVRKMNEREKERTYVCVCAFSCVRLRAYLCVFVQLFGHMRVACTCVKRERKRERRIGEKERGGETKREAKGVIFNVRV